MSLGRQFWFNYIWVDHAPQAKIRFEPACEDWLTGKWLGMRTSMTPRFLFPCLVLTKRKIWSGAANKIYDQYSMIILALETAKSTVVRSWRTSNRTGRQKTHQIGSVRQVGDSFWCFVLCFLPAACSYSLSHVMSLKWKLVVAVKHICKLGAGKSVKILHAKTRRHYAAGWKINKHGRKKMRWIRDCVMCTTVRKKFRVVNMSVSTGAMEFFNLG